MLEVKGLETCYGPSQVLFGMEFRVGEGEVVTLMGRNGMGKTTTIKSLMGMIPTRAGDISFLGKPIRGWPSYRVSRIGLGLVPEGRRIFPNLTVRENLVATEANRNSNAEPWTMENVLALFPRLGERLENWGNQLSGGEQQMLAIGRALLTNPRLLILDEATEGLAPLIRLEIWRCLELVKSRGQAILVIDKNLDHLLRIASRHYVVEKGRVVWHGNSSEFTADAGVRERYLGV
jgi:branched-chain amino acid transport system ATP-binding protein